MNKKVVRNLFIFGILIVSLSFVSAGFFSDFVDLLKPKTQVGLSPPTDGLVAHYTFDVDSSDASGNNNHGTSNGTVFIPEGKINGAAQFDQDQYVSLGGDKFETIETGSISLWIKVDNLSDISGGQLFSSSIPSSTDMVRGRIFNSGQAGVQDFGASSSSANNVWWSGSNVITEGTWHHLVFISDYEFGSTVNKDWEVYVDGTQVTLESFVGENSGAWFSDLDGDGHVFEIGRAQWNGSSPTGFKGFIDEFRIYDNVLTQAEIDELANEGNPICGNSVVELNEQCDDGNVVNGDGCDSSCMVEVVGSVCIPAQCNDGLDNDGDGLNDLDDPGCSNKNDNDEFNEPLPVCGNSVVELNEQCDDGNVVNGDGCDSSCMVEVVGSVCGNGILEEGEECDGTDLGTASCADYGLIGTVTCNSDCTLNTSACTTLDTGGVGS